MAIITGDMLVSTFRNYEWVRYQWGGAGPDTGWDCSGACNWIVGSFWHLDIPGHPGGTWGPALGHGPVVADWIQWVGVTRGGYPGVQPAAGDLVAWGPNAHMGMAVNSSRFISAANPSQGTMEADISGFFSYDPYVLRLLEVLTGAPVPGYLPQPPRTPANPMTNWSGAIVLAASHAYRAAANLHNFASATRRT